MIRKRKIELILSLNLLFGCSPVPVNPEQEAKDIISEYRHDIVSGDRSDVKISVGLIELATRGSERNCQFLNEENECKFVEMMEQEMEDLGWCYRKSRFVECKLN